RGDARAVAPSGRRDARAAGVARRAPARRGRHVTARVLVVDDEPQFLRALATSLRGAGYDVETAETASAALAAAGLHPPDAVVLEKSAVTVEGRAVHLTPHEFRILRLLVVNEGKLLTHRAILREVWGPAYGDESNYLHVYVSQLRRKLEPDPAKPRYLLTEAGAGYRLVAPAT